MSETKSPSEPGTVITNYFDALAQTGKPPHGPFDKERRCQYNAMPAPKLKRWDDE